jgi:hypothetical protein
LKRSSLRKLDSCLFCEAQRFSPTKRTLRSVTSAPDLWIF